MSSSVISQFTFRHAAITGGNSIAWEPSAFARTETNPAPQTSSAAGFNPEVSPNLLAPDEAGTYGNITPAPELLTWIAASLAAGVLLFSARHSLRARLRLATPNR
jgi:hypothetical protein